MKALLGYAAGRSEVVGKERVCHNDGDGDDEDGDPGVRVADGSAEGEGLERTDEEGEEGGVPSPPAPARAGKRLAVYEFAHSLIFLGRQVPPMKMLVP